MIWMYAVQLECVCLASESVNVYMYICGCA